MHDEGKSSRDTGEITDEQTHVKNEQRILRVHEFWWTVPRYRLNFLVPPGVPPIRPRHCTPRPSHYQNMFHRRTRPVLQGLVHNFLHPDPLSCPLTFINCYNNATPAIVDTLPQTFRAETSENEAMQGTDTSAGEHGHDRLPRGWHVDSHCVTLMHTVGLEYIGGLRSMQEQL